MSEKTSGDLEAILAMAIRRQRRNKWARLIEAIERSAEAATQERAEEPTAA